MGAAEVRTMHGEGAHAVGAHVAQSHRKERRTVRHLTCDRIATGRTISCRFKSSRLVSLARKNANEIRPNAMGRYQARRSFQNFNSGAGRPSWYCRVQKRGHKQD